MQAKEKVAVRAETVMFVPLFVAKYLLGVIIATNLPS